MTDAFCQLHHAGSSDRLHAFGGGYGALATQVTVRRAGTGGRASAALRYSPQSFALQASNSSTDQGGGKRRKDIARLTRCSQLPFPQPMQSHQAAVAAA